MPYLIEVTDTFAGEANYSWARREVIPGTPTPRQLVRRLKALMGLTGQRANVYWHDQDTLEIRPAGRDAPSIIGFALWVEDEEV